MTHPGENQTFAADARRVGTRVVALGLGAIAALLLLGGVVLFLTLPDAGVFNDRVERLFVENDTLTGEAELKLLEILAQIAALVFLVILFTLNRRMAEIERAGIEVNSLLISREEKTVYLNNHGFKLTDAAMETLSILAEARMDDEMLSGAQIEAMISGRKVEDCDEAAGATRIKRLRDTLGNQLVSELLVRNIARRGYMLSVGKDVIRVL